MAELPEVSVDLAGTGEPVLLIHGFLEMGSMWNFLMDQFPGKQFIIPDLLGHGESELGQEPLSMRLQAEICLEILDELEIDQAHIIGHSMGGYIASEIGALAPERVKTMMLMHSSCAGPRPDRNDDRQRGLELVQKDKRRYCQTMIRSLFPEEYAKENEGLLAKLTDSAVDMKTEAIVQSLEAMKVRSDHKDTLKERPFPLSYFLGEDDQLFPIQLMEEECEYVEADEVCVLEGIGHMAQFESPEIAKEFIAHWFEATVQS